MSIAPIWLTGLKLGFIFWGTLFFISAIDWSKSDFSKSEFLSKSSEN